jgi:hypothetical protein
MTRRTTSAGLLCVALLLAACGDRHDKGDNAGNAASDALPAPEGARGSVTGMPDRPGPGQVGPPDISMTNASSIGIPSDAPVDGLPPPDPGDGLPIDGFADEPTPEDAVAVVRDYYAAINAGNFDHAYALWSDGGNASGQTPRQFAGGFATTRDVSVQIDDPGNVDAAAGSRYIEVPVAITATHRDGGVHRYVGAYILRRAVVDGATAEQRAWRIQSSDIREVRP